MSDPIAYPSRIEARGPMIKFLTILIILSCSGFVWCVVGTSSGVLVVPSVDSSPAGTLWLARGLWYITCYRDRGVDDELLPPSGGL